VKVCSCQTIGRRSIRGSILTRAAEAGANEITWALLAADRDGKLEFAGPAILNPPRQDRGKWSELMAVR